MGTKVLSNQRVTVLAGLASSIADWTHVTLAELTAMTNVSAAINWNSFALTVKASDHKDDRTLTDAAGAQSRSPYINFDGIIQLVMPQVADTASIYRTAYNLFSNDRVELVVAIRHGALNSTAPAAGDKWTIFHLITDAVAFAQDDVSKHYQVSLKSQDDALVDYIVPPAVATPVVLTALSAAVVHPKLVFVSAAYEGWDITKAATYTSSDETLLVQVHPGIFQTIAAGSPTIVAHYPGATDSTALAITIT